MEMMVKLQNAQYANERVGVNESTYTADGFGIIIALPADAEILISVAGWKKLEDVTEDNRVRLPETPDEFLAACRRANLSASDLRQMAQFLEAHETVDFLPAEPDDVEPDLPEDAFLGPDPEEMEATLDPLEPIGDADDEQQDQAASESEGGSGNGNGEGTYKTKKILLQMAKDMGITVDGRWGRQKLLDAIEGRSAT